MHSQVILHKVETINNLWRTAHRQQIAHGDVSFLEICNDLEKCVKKMSLDTSSILISGAARTYASELDDLFDDLAKLDNDLAMRNRRRPFNEDIQSESSSTSLASPSCPSKVTSTTRPTSTVYSTSTTHSASTTPTSPSLPVSSIQPLSTSPEFVLQESSEQMSDYEDADVSPTYTTSETRKRESLYQPRRYPAFSTITEEGSSIYGKVNSSNTTEAVDQSERSSRKRQISGDGNSEHERTNIFNMTNKGPNDGRDAFDEAVIGSAAESIEDSSSNITKRKKNKVGRTSHRIDVAAQSHLQSKQNNFSDAGTSSVRDQMAQVSPRSMESGLIRHLDIGTSMGDQEPQLSRRQSEQSIDRNLLFGSISLYGSCHCNPRIPCKIIFSDVELL